MSEHLDFERPSKTQRKAEIEHLKAFGRELVDLPAGKFVKLELPAELRRAVELARRIQSAPARNREVQGLGRLMAYLPEFDEAALRTQLSAIDHGTFGAASPIESVEPVPSELESLSQRLLRDGDEAIFELTERYPRETLQSLRQIVRVAQKKLRSGADPRVATKDVVAWLTRPS